MTAYRHSMNRILKLLKNSIVQINKIALIEHFHKTETDEKFIFQQLYSKITQNYIIKYLIFCIESVFCDKINGTQF